MIHQLKVCFVLINHVRVIRTKLSVRRTTARKRSGSKSSCTLLKTVTEVLDLMQLQTNWRLLRRDQKKVGAKLMPNVIVTLHFPLQMTSRTMCNLANDSSLTSNLPSTLRLYTCGAVQKVGCRGLTLHFSCGVLAQRRMEDAVFKATVPRHHNNASFCNNLELCIE